MGIWYYMALQAFQGGYEPIALLGRIQLAEYLSADVSALTRELNCMKEEGLIDFEKNTFRIMKSLY